MKKLFYVEKDSFLRLMVEEAMKAEGHMAFTAENALDIEYLVTDMAPDFLLFDLDTIANHTEKVRALLNNDLVSQIPYGFTGSEERLAELGFGTPQDVLLLEKPIAPLNLVQTLFHH